MFVELCVHDGQAAVRQAKLSGDSSCFSFHSKRLAYKYLLSYWQT